MYSSMESCPAGSHTLPAMISESPREDSEISCLCPHFGSWVAVPSNPTFAGPKLGDSGTLCAQNEQGSHACVPTPISQQR